MLKILHFADAHIDIAAQGRRDPETGLPLRVLDFLKALDTIVDTAISERVDLVLFAGDAYKDRSPAPTFQREWGRRIMRLSRAGIPTVLLVGNHDLSPAVGRANAMQEFETLEVPNVQLLGKPCFLSSQDLFGLPLQLIALPWISRSGMMSALQVEGMDSAQIYTELEVRLGELVNTWLEAADPSLPVVLTAHCSVQGAVYGGERSVMLGSDLVLSGSVVKDPRLSYVALGHIHKAQDLNKDSQPPVIYPGSIERVDFGEVNDEKFFVIASIEKGKDTQVEWRKLEGRRFIDRFITLETSENIMEQIINQLPAPDLLEGAVMRLALDYPRAWENLLDEASLRHYAEAAFEFHLVRRPRMEARLRLPGDETIGSLTPLDLLDIYWRTMKTQDGEAGELQKLANEIIHSTRGPREEE
jgi:DNA repair protein SbcD/Mre11